MQPRSLRKNTVLLGHGAYALAVPSVDNPALSKVLPLKPGAGKDIPMHASQTARNLFLSNF